MKVTITGAGGLIGSRLVDRLQARGDDVITLSRNPSSHTAAPEPVTNATFSKALGRALHRPAFAPVPGLAVRTLYGQMAEIVTTGQRVVPRRAQEHGYAFAHPDLDEALRSALA
jgi:NAD dependent epimerase/dehydratase family enzyme